MRNSNSSVFWFVKGSNCHCFSGILRQRIFIGFFLYFYLISIKASVRLNKIKDTIQLSRVYHAKFILLSHSARTDIPTHNKFFSTFMALFRSES